MLFQYTYESILAGRKTQTRRVRKSSDTAVQNAASSIEAVLVNGREKWRVGKTYSVQPARGKPQIGRIRISAIRSEPVQAISDADATAEGFSTRDDFLSTWVQVNGAKNSHADVWVLEFRVVS